MDVEASESNFFTEKHRSLLSLIASRVAIGVENARLYTRVARQAQQLVVLNEISRELTIDPQPRRALQAHWRAAAAADRLPDVLHSAARTRRAPTLQHRFSLRFKENVQFKHEIPLGRGLVGWRPSRTRRLVVPDVTQGRALHPAQSRDDERAHACRWCTRARSSACSTWNTRARTTLPKSTRA